MISRLVALPGAIALAATLLAACGSLSGGQPRATAALMPTAAINPNPSIGTVAFTALDHGVRVAGEVRGLPPGTEHGVHIHEKGDCGDNGNASGGHFNPSGGTHGKFGAAGSHAGEMPSLVADASGVVQASFVGALLKPRFSVGRPARVPNEEKIPGDQRHDDERCRQRRRDRARLDFA